MSKTVEEPVSAEPVKAATPTGAAAFAAARESLRASQEPEQPPAEPATPPTDDTPTPTPAQEPAVADEPPDTTPTEDAILSAEELAALPPKQRAQAEKWQAKLTKRAQALSAQAKQYDEWKPLIDGFTNDPDATLEQLAKQRGLTVAKPAQDTTVKTDIQSQFTEAIEALAPEIRPLFQPALEALGKKLMATVEGRLKPIADAQTQMISEASAAETQATEKAFEAKYPDYRKVEPQMLELGKQFIPVAGTMTDYQYLETLYTLAKSKQTKVEQIKETVKQINQSVESAEPPTRGVPEGRVEQTMPANWNDMTGKERMRAAYDAASKGVIWKK